MSDDDIDNMDFDLPAELTTPSQSQPTGLPSGFPGFPGMPGMGMPGMQDAMQGLDQLTAMDPKVLFPPIDPSKLDEIKSYQVLYPLYLNSSFSLRKGRKVDGIPNPSALIMSRALDILGVEHFIESKRHPRDPFTFGRIRFKGSEKKALLRRIVKVWEEARDTLSEQDLKLEAISRSDIPFPTLPNAAQAAQATQGDPPAASSVRSAPTVPATPSVPATTAQQKSKKKSKKTRK